MFKSRKKGIYCKNADMYGLVKKTGKNAVVFLN